MLLKAYVATLDRRGHGTGAVVDIELLEDARHVSLDRVFTYRQQSSDLLVGTSLRHQAQHFEFTRGKRTLGTQTFLELIFDKRALTEQTLPVQT